MHWSADKFMDDTAQEIRKLCLMPGVIEMLGGRLKAKDIRRHIEQYGQLMVKKLINRHIKRQRYTVGYHATRPEGIVGYMSCTIMNNANPTSYEKEHIGLEGKLNYVQGKVMAVHPDFRGGDVSTQLMHWGLGLAYERSDWVGDVIASNEPMLRFLEKYGINVLFEWATPKGTRMYRVGIPKDEIHIKNVDLGRT